MNANLTESIVNRTPTGATAVVKFHASLNVSNLERSLVFYRALFGCEPAKAYNDYVKFELAEPPLILSLKPKRASSGGPLNHLGMRLTSTERLAEIGKRLEAVGARPSHQKQVECCYARQTKIWVTDPDNTLWEIYVLHDDIEKWGSGNKLKLMAPPLLAMGLFGSLRRFFANTFCRRCRKPVRDAEYADNEATTARN